MSIEDAPITRFTNMRFQPDANIIYNGMVVPRLTLEEIANILLIDENIGQIIFNVQAEELQYLAPTFNWVNVSTDGGEPTFEELTVTGNTNIGGNLAVLGGLSVVGATTVTTLNASTINASGSIISGATVFGARAGGYIYTANTSSFAATSNVPLKISATTTAGYQNQFTATNNKLQFVESSAANFMEVDIIGSFSCQFSVDTTLTLLIAINGTVLNPGSKCFVTAGNFVNLTVNKNDGVVSNSGIGDYVELWVMSSVSGTFSAGGTMSLRVTQV